MRLPPGIVHFASLPRLVPHSLNVAQIGYLPAKTEWVDWQFDVIAFSLILTGAGRLYAGKVSFDIQAPCVISEFPGPRFRYGPRPHWRELYFTYPASSLASLKRNGFIRAGRFTWPIVDDAPLGPLLDELADLLGHCEKPGHADRADRLVDRVLAESLLGSQEPPITETHRRVLQLKRYLEQHYVESLDVDRIARGFGFSRSAFRRQWHDHVPESPGRFVNELRMKRARRLLCETDLPIGHIARSVGFDDALYFSKRFRKLVGESAREYRARWSR